MADIKFACTIVYVKDIERSKKFYSETLGLKILKDRQSIVYFEGNFAIHDAKKINRTVFKTNDFDSKSDENQGKGNILIYFESEKPDEWCKELKEKGVVLIHEVEEQAWGQSVFRFYDPDKHIVEIGKTK